MPQNEYSDKELKLESEQLDYLKNIDQRLYRLTSMRWVFLMGLVKGFSTVIGATIIAGIVFAILSMMLSSVGGVPVLNQFIDNTMLQEVLDNGLN